MEKLYIRGKLILLLREHATRSEAAPDAEQEYSIDVSDLIDLVRGEFGVALPEEMMDELSSIEPVVDFICEHAGAEGR